MRRLIAVPTVLLALTAAGCADDGDPTTAASSSTGTGPRPEGTPGNGPASPTVPGQPMECGVLRGALGEAGDVTLYADPGVRRHGGLRRGPSGDGRVLRAGTEGGP